MLFINIIILNISPLNFLNFLEMFIVKSNLSSLFLRQPRVSFCLSVASYYGGDRPQYDNQQRYQNRENRSEGYGDQRPYYIQNLRNTKRVGGDAQLYHFYFFKLDFYLIFKVIRIVGRTDLMFLDMEGIG